MAVKKCCVENCKSSSTRKEDAGVTYHKFPKDSTLHATWVSVTHHQHNTDAVHYVCSRHFCKSDFQIYKDSKYILKSDAVPSIFSWTKADIKTSVETKAENMEKEEDITISETPAEKDNENLNSSKESECENVDAIKKFIESQDKEILDAKLNLNKMENEEVTQTEEKIQEKPKNPDLELENITEAVEVKIDTEANEKVDVEVDVEPQNETLAVASSVIDMILDNSEAKLTANEKKENRKIFPKESPSASVKGNNNSVALSIGSKVEAKDFGEYWHPAEIIEVDFDEMEVLVHYEDANKKLDEWISVSSPRLRPKGSGSPAVPPPPEGSAPSTSAASDVPPASTHVVNEEVKVEEKPKITFAVGERCLARWRDNRRFIATVNADLGDGKYEVVFDDGTKWTCSVIRLSKVKDSVKDPLTIDTSGVSASPSTPSPVYGPGPSNAGVLPTPVPAYNTHLFDPARDYLGSKSERRLMKRKLNIKEIFNIGQKKKKTETPKVVKEKAPTPKVEKEKAPTPKVEKEKAPTPKVVKDKKPNVKKVKMEPREVLPLKKKEIPDAVASIIGTVSKESPQPEEEEVKVEAKTETEETEVTVVSLDTKMDIDDGVSNSETLSSIELQVKQDEEPEPVVEEEVKLEKFEKEDDEKHEKVLDRIKEAIIKLEGGLRQPEVKLEKLEINEGVVEAPKTEEPVSSDVTTPPKPEKKKSLSKIKKVKKVRLLQEKKVKRQVEKVKSELEEMKRQMEEMRKKMSEELSKTKKVQEMPESFLLPGEWCCKWVNGQPLGTVSEIEHEGKGDGAKPVLPRRSVQVEDKRLPPGWTKHMVRRSFGTSAGKWDVVLMTPDNRRIHTKTDMKHYLENNPDEALQNFIPALMDFGVHLKLSRRMGWYTTTPGGETQLPVNTLSSNSPLLVNRKKLSLKKNKLKDGKRKKIRMKLKVPKGYGYEPYPVASAVPGTSGDLLIDDIFASADAPPENMPLEDGFVYVGSLKVQIIENLLRCPAEGCFKNFRNNTLLKMHIKHYHRELRKMLGATPKVLDLAYARTRPTQMEMRRLKLEAQQKTIRVKLPKPQKKIAEPKLEKKDTTIELKTELPLTPIKSEGDKIPRSLDSPKLRHALINKPLKRPKVLLPVRRSEMDLPEIKSDDDTDDSTIEPTIEVPLLAEPLDFETAISTHTVTKPLCDKKRDKKKKTFASIQKRPLTGSEDEDWLGVNSDMDTRSSYPRSGTPDSKIDQKLISSESNEEQKDGNYLYTENGERIKIVHMKREEIINCHCGFREEDGLMVQCELCLCWQHGLCHNIQKESDVPEKYTCSICLNPRRGRRSQRFLHDQDRLYEGLLPGAKPCESLRRSHELSGNLHRIEDALHALRVKYHVATKKDHPKLYLWAKDWETGDLSLMQEKLNSDYSDLNIMISNIGKENLPVKPEDIKDMPLDIRTPPSEETEGDRFSQKDNQLGSQALLSGLLSSPGGASLDLPISTSELERLAKTVQAEQEAQRVIAPQPEAAIENSACRQHLLRHIQRCQALIDARLDSIEAQVAELESQDPSFEDDETADYFPRTKQTIQMLMRDLDTMDELGVIT